MQRFHNVPLRIIKDVSLEVVQELAAEIKIVAMQISPRTFQYGVTYETEFGTQPEEEIGVEVLRYIADVLAIRHCASVEMVTRRCNDKYEVFLIVNHRAVNGTYINPAFTFPILAPGDPAKWS